MPVHKIDLSNLPQPNQSIKPTNTETKQSHKQKETPKPNNKKEKIEPIKEKVELKKHNNDDNNQKETIKLSAQNKDKQKPKKNKLFQRRKKVSSDKTKNPLSSLKSFFSKAVKTLTPKEDLAAKNQNTSPNESQKNSLSEIVFYLKSQQIIDGEGFLNFLINSGFQLLHSRGYYHRAVIIQDANGEVINRMNIDDDRDMIRIYLDPKKLTTEFEFEETMSLISKLAQQLNCEILNFKKNPITQEDLKLIHKAVFGS